MTAPPIGVPLLTPDHLPANLHWIDPIAQMTVVRQGNPAVLLSLPLPLTSFSPRSLRIGPGSVWFAAGPFAALAAGGFAGLRVLGGVLNTEADMTAAGLQLTVPVFATAVLILELAQVSTSPVAGPGADWTAASIHVPSTVTIVLAPSGLASTVSVSEVASLEVYGVSTILSPRTDPVGYDADTRDLTVPMSVDQSVFAPGVSASTVAVPHGSALVHAGAWAIPVAFTAADSLGQADGAGALRLVLGPGISFQLPPFQIEVGLKRAVFSVGPSLLEVGGDVARAVTCPVKLWDETTPQSIPPRRSSSVVLEARPGDQFLVREGAGLELVAVRGGCAASIDRPRLSTGGRLVISFPQALFAVVLTTSEATGFAVGSAGDVPATRHGSIVLENAVLIVDKPHSMVASGPLANGRISSGTLRLDIPSLGTVPIFPDPYAANFPLDGLILDTPQGAMTVTVRWESPRVPVLDIQWSQAANAANIGLDGAHRRELALLDVSTNADLLGVQVRGQSEIVNSVLSAVGASLAVFTVPGVSWEPVEVADPTVVIANPPNDGVKTTIAVETARLVPVEPVPLLRAFVAEVHSGHPAEMQFMLPFGLIASAFLPGREVRSSGASFELRQPSFSNGLQGAHQLVVRPLFPERSTAGFQGNLRASSAVATDVLGPIVFGFVDGEFGPQGTRGIVPVRRVDLSGYGNSMFSDWTNPAEVAGVAEARFDVLIGRTSYEVIQVVSVIYPHAIRAVRTITLARQDGGRIRRDDTGWQRLSDGAFDLPTGVVAHPGPVLRIVNVHNIKDEAQTLNPAPGVELQTVSFDADVLLSPDLGVPDGGIVDGSGTRVPSRGLVGYLQRLPIGRLLQLDEFGQLMQEVGAAGGPLACTVDLGGAAVKGALVRVTGLGVSTAGNPNSPGIVVALLGAPRLPSTGAWAMGRLPAGAPAPQALDPNAPVPLIRPNFDPTWHLADPADIDRLAAPAGTRYGLIQATGTQRVFFPRPQVPQGSSQISLPEAPHLADVAALLNATGVFPELANALSFDQPPQMTAVGDMLTIGKHTWPLTGVPPKTLLHMTPVEVVLAYADENGTPSTASVVMDPGGVPSWAIDIGTLSIDLIIPQFGSAGDPLLRLTGSLHADSTAAPSYRNLVVHFGGALSLIEQIFSRLQELAKFLPGGSAHLDVTFADGRLTIRDGFTLPNLPLGLGQITDVGLNLGVTVSLSPPSLDFTVGIASADKPFHWLVSPLSGTGAVEVGFQDGKPTLLVQAGLGVGLGIDLGIASGSASVVLAFQVDNRVSPIELKVILTGQAAVDVLDGLASASLCLVAAMAIAPDKLPIPDYVTLFAEVAVGIHITLCWIASVDFDGSWHVSQTLSSPLS